MSYPEINMTEGPIEKEQELSPIPTKKAERRKRVAGLLEEYRGLPSEDIKGKEKIADLFEAMLEQAEQTDPDTEFYNKKGLAAELPRLMDLSIRSGKPLTIGFMDGYRLKRVNEKISYDAGTQVILTTANAIRASTRKSDVQVRINPDDITAESNPEEDIATRPGGDEFVVIFFGSNKFQAAEIVQRIQRKLSEIAPKEIPFYRATFGEDYTVRAGVVEYDPNIDKDSTRLLKRADECLNIAKKEPIPGMICIGNYNPETKVNEVISLKGLQMQFSGL